jgi:GTP diphosphokinase / guanosine-3',5'-bis(diphosphate) 3'-diphosphatase
VKAIATIISDANTNIRNMDAKTVEDNATVEIVVDIADLKHLERILTGVRKIPGVRDVQRVQKL